MVLTTAQGEKNEISSGRKITLIPGFIKSAPTNVPNPFHRLPVAVVQLRLKDLQVSNLEATRCVRCLKKGELGPIKTRCLGHVTGYQPIRDHYLGAGWLLGQQQNQMTNALTKIMKASNQKSQDQQKLGTDRKTNQKSLFRSRDWLSANQGHGFHGPVGSRTKTKSHDKFEAHVQINKTHME